METEAQQQISAQQESSARMTAEMAEFKQMIMIQQQAQQQAQQHLQQMMAEKDNRYNADMLEMQKLVNEMAGQLANQTSRNPVADTRHYQMDYDDSLITSSMSEVSPQKPTVGVDIPQTADERDQSAQSQFAGGMGRNEDAENNESGNKKYFNQYSASTGPQAEPSRAESDPSPANAAAPIFVIPHEQNYKEVESITLDPWPQPTGFRDWKISFFKKVSTGSGRVKEGIKWIKEVEDVSSYQDLSSDGPGWQGYSMKLADALSKIFNGNPNFKNKVNLIEEELLNKEEVLNGRQMTWLMFNFFKRPDVEVGMTDFNDLQKVCLKGDNLIAFVHDWDKCLLGMKTRPTDDILECLFTNQVRKCKHFEQVFVMYETQCLHQGLEKSYDALRSRVDVHLEQRKQQNMVSPLNENGSSNA